MQAFRPYASFGTTFQVKAVAVDPHTADCTVAASFPFYLDAYETVGQLRRWLVEVRVSARMFSRHPACLISQYQKWDDCVVHLLLDRYNDRVRLLDVDQQQIRAELGGHISPVILYAVVLDKAPPPGDAASAAVEVSVATRIRWPLSRIAGTQDPRYIQARNAIERHRHLVHCKLVLPTQQECREHFFGANGMASADVDSLDDEDDPAASATNDDEDRQPEPVPSPPPPAPYQGAAVEPIALNRARARAFQKRQRAAASARASARSGPRRQCRPATRLARKRRPSAEPASWTRWTARARVSARSPRHSCARAARRPPSTATTTRRRTTRRWAPRRPRRASRPPASAPRATTATRTNMTTATTTRPAPGPAPSAPATARQCPVVRSVPPHLLPGGRRTRSAFGADPAAPFHTADWLFSSTGPRDDDDGRVAPSNSPAAATAALSRGTEDSPAAPVYGLDRECSIAVCDESDTQRGSHARWLCWKVAARRSRSSLRRELRRSDDGQRFRNQNCRVHRRQARPVQGWFVLMIENPFLSQRLHVAASQSVHQQQRLPVELQE